MTGAAIFIAGIKMKFRRLWHRQDGEGNFTEMVTNGNDVGPVALSDYKLIIYQGNSNDSSSIKASEIPVTDDVESKLAEQFLGSDDPRLPADVLSMPIGKREDFVDEFNFWYWFYYKEEDPDYNENESKAVNAVNFALKKAYTYANRVIKDPVGQNKDGQVSSANSGTESGIPESSPTLQESITTSDGKTAYRIKESVTGVIVPGSFKESKTKGEGDVDVIIIKKGWSLNDRYYGDEAIEGIKNQIEEQKPGFMNHGPTFGRDPRDWAIYLHSSERVDDEIHAKMHVYDEPDGGFLKERIAKSPHMFGGSIDAYVIQEEGKAEGREGTIVTEVALLNCWDIVMFPAAGGAIVGTATESQAVPKVAHKIGEAEKMDLETLKKEHPSLYALIVSEATSAAKAEMAAELKEAEDKREAAEAKNRELTAELDGIKSAKEKQEKQDKFSKELNTLLNDTFEDGEVSEEFKALLVEEGADNMPRIKKMVAERKKMLDGINTKVAENGDDSAGSTTEQTKTLADEEELARFAKK